MEPEISRRCPACGAAVRLRSTFCANCGRPTNNETAVDTSAVPEAPATQEDESASVVNLPDTASPPTLAVADEPDFESLDEKERLADDETNKGGARVVTFIEQGAPGGARTKRQRVRTAAREAVEENLLPRVEKLRQASNVVLDEAAYDPSLRFILIALALFVVFLLILLASKVFG
jgi:hypothetical protein